MSPADLLDSVCARLRQVLALPIFAAAVLVLLGVLGVPVLAGMVGSRAPPPDGHRGRTHGRRLRASTGTTKKAPLPTSYRAGEFWANMAMRTMAAAPNINGARPARCNLAKTDLRSVL
jgi:hypothetical protein